MVFSARLKRCAMLVGLLLLRDRREQHRAHVGRHPRHDHHERHDKEAKDYVARGPPCSIRPSAIGMTTVIDRIATIAREP